VRETQNKEDGLNDNIRTIQRVADMFGVTMSDLTSAKRTQELAWARQVAMYVLRARTTLPYKQIGALLGGRDHSTVLYGVRRVKEEMSTREDMRHDIEKLLNGHRV